jgi:hypothetical protein
MLYVIIVIRLGIGLLKQYFISGFLLPLPSFLLMGGLASIIDVVAARALQFYAFAMTRGHDPFKAAVVSLLLAIAILVGLIALFIFIWSQNYWS